MSNVLEDYIELSKSLISLLEGSFAKGNRPVSITDIVSNSFSDSPAVSNYFSKWANTNQKNHSQLLESSENQSILANLVVDFLEYHKETSSSSRDSLSLSIKPLSLSTKKPPTREKKAPQEPSNSLGNDMKISLRGSISIKKYTLPTNPDDPFNLPTLPPPPTTFSLLTIFPFFLSTSSSADLFKDLPPLPPIPTVASPLPPSPLSQPPQSQNSENEKEGFKKTVNFGGAGMGMKELLSGTRMSTTFPRSRFGAPAPPNVTSTTNPTPDTSTPSTTPTPTSAPTPTPTASASISATATSSPSPAFGAKPSPFASRFGAKPKAPATPAVLPSASPIVGGASASVSVSVGGVKAKDDPRFTAFFRDKENGVSAFILKNKMKREGYDYDILERPDDVIP